jgi:hypothetical protein
MLFLCLYYASAGVIFGVVDVSSERAATAVANVLTPAAAFSPAGGELPASALVGIALQLIWIAVITSAIRARVQRTVLVPAAA